jgi:tubulin beta
MANDTATMRFPGAENNADLRKLCTNLIPFPRLHFLMQGQAPLISRAQTKYITMNEGQIVKDLFDPRCLMNDADLKNGRILTGSILFRGDQVSGSEVENKIHELTNKKSSQFVEWIPNHIMTSICKFNPPSKPFSMQGNIIVNSTAIASPMEKLLINFNKMLRKKAYVHWYTNEGMDI